MDWKNGRDFCISGLMRPGAKVVGLTTGRSPRSMNHSPVIYHARFFLLRENELLFTLSVWVANFNQKDCFLTAKDARVRQGSAAGFELRRYDGHDEIPKVV